MEAAREVQNIYYSLIHVALPLQKMGDIQQSNNELYL